MGYRKEVDDDDGDVPNFLVRRLSVEIMGIRSHYITLKLKE